MGETDQKYTGRKKTAGQKAYKEENQMEAYQNTALSPEERAKDLLGRMTLKEKVGQLNQRLYGFRIYERQGEEFTLTDEFKEEVERMGGLGVCTACTVPTRGQIRTRRPESCRNSPRKPTIWYSTTSWNIPALAFR